MCYHTQSVMMMWAASTCGVIVILMWVDTAILSRSYPPLLTLVTTITTRLIQHLRVSAKSKGNVKNISDFGCFLSLQFILYACKSSVNLTVNVMFSTSRPLRIMMLSFQKVWGSCSPIMYQINDKISPGTELTAIMQSNRLWTQLYGGFTFSYRLLGRKSLRELL